MTRTPRLWARGIPYVISTRRGDISSRVEDPRMVYIDHQLRNPMVGLLQHVIKSTSSLFVESQKRMSNLNHGRKENTSFFK